MNARTGIRTAAAGALLLIALILGARRVGRELASPFEGFDRLAWARPAAVTEEPPEAGLEIDLPVVEVEPSRESDDSLPIENRVVRAGGGSHSRSTNALQVEMKLNVADVALNLVAKRALLSLVLDPELDIDRLASTLTLSESQKARLSDLIEWRKSTLDALKQVEGSGETAKAIDGTFRAALEAELDPAQALAYRKMKESGTGVVLVRGSAELALTQVQTRTEPLFIQSLLKSLVQE